MTGFAKVSLFLLRVGIGWLFFYAGITKVLDSAWSAEKYLVGAKTFPGFYQWLASPGVLPMTNLLNEWGLTLIGAALILGIFVRLASLAGVVVMLLYYFPIVQFPRVEHGFIVDEHIIYALALLVLATSRAGKVWGLERLRR